MSQVHALLTAQLATVTETVPLVKQISKLFPTVPVSVTHRTASISMEMIVRSAQPSVRHALTLLTASPVPQTTCWTKTPKNVIVPKFQILAILGPPAAVEQTAGIL